LLPGRGVVGLLSGAGVSASTDGEDGASVGEGVGAAACAALSARDAFSASKSTPSSAASSAASSGLTSAVFLAASWPAIFILDIYLGMRALVVRPHNLNELI